LLLACVLKWPGQVRAIHIHHGLQDAADQFAKHCQQLCEQLQVPLLLCKVNAKHDAGQSPEDAARRARYSALSEAVHTHPDLKGVKDVALAQHADDQVETLLLALSRGAGLPGLASMPAQWSREGLQWHRPLLNVPGAKLREYLTQAQVAWVEDPTNQDEQFTRNRIRAQLLPVLEQAFPQFRETFARSASHAAEAQEILNEVAAADLASVLESDSPAIKALQGLSQARQSLVLRHWLKVQHQTTPSTVQLTALISQIAACTTRGHQIHLKLGRGYVRREGPVLSWSTQG
jgi:tRNA(Ile)-lysidine synthase